MIIRLLLSILLISFAAQAQVTVLVSKNHRGNTKAGTYRKGAIVEVRSDHECYKVTPIDTLLGVGGEPDTVVYDTTVAFLPHPIGTKEPTAFYILRVSDGDAGNANWATWTEVDTVSPPAARGRRAYRLRANYLNTLDTYDTLTFVDFTDKVIPKDQGFLHGYEEPREERWAGIKLEVPLWIRRLMPAVATSATVNPDGGGADYTSLNAAESGEQKDLVTATETLTINCTSDGTADATQVTFLGWTTSATYFPTVNGENQSASTVGVWDASIYRLTPSVTTTGAIKIDVDDMDVKNIQIQPTFSGSWGAGIWLGGTATVNTVISNCIVTMSGSSTNSYGISAGLAGTTTIKNCIVYDITGSSDGTSYDVANGTVSIYNCTANGSGSGVDERGGTLTISNSIVQNCTDNFQGTLSGDYNIEDDNDADTPGANSIKNTAVTFQDAASDDYRLASGSRGIDEGTDLSGSGVTDDIAGTARPVGAAFDMGFYEFLGTFDRYIRLNSWYAYGSTNVDTVVIGARGASGLAFIDSNIVYLTGTAANYTTDYLNALLLISFNIGGDSTLYWYDYANSDTVAMGSPAVTVQSTPFATTTNELTDRFKRFWRFMRFKR